MAARFWVGGTGTWDATTTANWSATSGGAGGASVPVAADTVTINTASITVTTNYNVSVTSVTINASGATLSLGGNLTCTSAITLTAGTFTANSFAVAATQLSSSNFNVRTIDLGSSTVTLNSFTPLNLSTSSLTFNAGTSTIVCPVAATTFGTAGTQNTPGFTFYNVSFTATTAHTSTIVAINTFNNLSVRAPNSAGVTTLTFQSRQTINGALTTTSTAGNRRVWFRGVTLGVAQTLTINGAPSLTDADFRDIYVIGTAAPISGTRIGDLRGIRGITADAPKTVYWNLAGAQNWSADAWAATPTGAQSTDFFPLAQDTATFTNAGSVTGTITMNSAIPYTGTVDMSGRTSAMTLAVNSFTIYGNWANGSGTTLSGTPALIFSGRNTQTITSSGRNFSGGITVESYGGTVELTDALNNGANIISVQQGTFDTKGYNVSCGSLSASTLANVTGIKLGSSTVTIVATSTVLSGGINFTFDAGTSTIIVPADSPIIGDFNRNFYNLSLTGTTASTTVAVANGCTFNNLTITAPSAAGIITVNFQGNQTINGTLTCAGATAVRRICLRSNFLGLTRTLTVNSLSAQDCDFRDITIAGAAAGSSPTRAGDCGGNAGITFPAPKTVYWNLAFSQNWSATAWAALSGGTPDINNFPLAQDTAVFDDAGSVTGTITLNQAWNIGTFDSSARTSAMTMANISIPTFYGDWLSGTGLTTTLGGTIVFGGRGTQTITTNGRQLNFTLDVTTFAGTVQLADALTLNSNTRLILTSGTFDAVTYNVTIGGYSGFNNAKLKMGSGTWTLSGTGTVWDMALTPIFYKGTANIVLSNTTTAARTFVGSGQSYNKLTIGGATGVSTLTITGNNQFTELASAKTVANTIALGTTTQTFGAWTVTGTVGNVVTVTGTSTIIIAGSRVSGVNYLAMGTTTVSATSPGEFYSGVNSTGTGAGILRTAAPAPVTRYWVGGTGTWDAGTPARWSATSGGAGGASPPTSADAVVFDTLSNATAYTVTCTATQLRCGSLTMAGPLVGNVTWAGTAPIAIHDNVSLAATGITRTYTGAITLSGSTTGKTLTTNGVTLFSALNVDGVGCGWVLSDALSNGSQTFTFTNGSFDTAGYNLTGASITSFLPNARTIDLGASTVSLSTSINFGATESIKADLNFVAGTSQINFSNTSATLGGNDQTFYNVNFTSTSVSTVAIDGFNTFNNLSFAGITSAGLKVVSLSANQTVNGTLTFSAGTNATRRTFLQSSILGTTRTLTCATFSGTDADFRDINITGAAAPVSGTRLGNCAGNSGITFDAAKTVYRAGAGGFTNWSDASGAAPWSFTNGGTADVTAFPLAQDTAVFPSSPTPYPANGGTVTVNAPYNIGTIDMSARTSNAMTLGTGNLTIPIYGNLIAGTGVTFQVTVSSTFTFSGYTTQTITSAGRTFNQSIAVSSPGGSVVLQDALSLPARSLSVTNGTFNANGYSVTANNLQSNSSFVRAVATGAGTWTLSGSGNVWLLTSTNLTVTGTSTVNLTSAGARTFAGGSISYSGITLNQAGAGTLTITGSNTFANISNTYSATGATTIALGAETQTVGNFTASGESGRVLTVTGTSSTTPATLILNSVTPTRSNYLAITGVRAYDLVDTWYAGADSTNNGSLGWYFESNNITISAFITESVTAADVVGYLRVFLADVAESATATDVLASIRVFLSSVAESSTAADVVASLRALLAGVSESATAADVVDLLRVFLADVSESATSSDLLSAALTLSASIAELTTVSDAAVVESRVSFPTVAELIVAADVLSGGLLLSANIAEASTGADSATGANTASMNIEESSAAADAGANSNTTTPTISETATPSDAFAGVYTGTSSVAEAAQMTDSFSNNLLFLSSITEATTAQEIATAILIFSRTVSEATTASEVLVAVAAFNAVVPESVTGADVANALVSVGGFISEALTALDVAVAAKASLTAILEAATAQEAASNVYTANPVIAETASPLDAAQSANTGSSSLSESATVSEDQVAQISALSAVVEVGTAQETAAANLLFVTRVAETAALADSASVAPSTFGVVALAAAQAAASFNPAGSVYNAILAIQGASAADSILGAYRWNLINDNQTINWQNVTNSQGSGWSQVNTDGTTNWQPIITP